MHEPGDLDRLAAEMAEIGVERLGAGDDQEDQAHDGEADDAVRQDELDAEQRVEGQEHARVVDDVDQAADGQHDEPDQHDRPEELRDLRRAARLHGKQQHQNDDRERQHRRASMLRARPASGLPPRTAPRWPA